MTIQNYVAAPAVNSFTSFNMPSLQEIQQLTEFCKVLASSPFYNKLTAGGVMAIYLTARERDLPFMSCLNGGLHCFDGKVTYSAIMIDSLILKAGHKTEVLHLDEHSCKIRFTRGDRKNDPDYKPFEFEYTTQKAHKAGYLSKKNWQTSLDDMLYCRCITGGGRKHIPEVFVGVLVTGELVGDDSDGHVPPSLPPGASMRITQPEPEAPIAIENKPMPGFDEFVQKHGLSRDTNKSHDADKVKFMMQNCEKSKKTELEMINSFMKYEDLFERRFESWKQIQKKTETPIEIEVSESNNNNQPTEVDLMV